MQIKAFTLIELLIVIFIIGVVSFLVLKLPSFSNPQIKIENLKNLTYPNKIFYLFDDGNNLLIGDKNKSLNIVITAPTVYIYKDDKFIKKEFKRINNKNVIFKYYENNGLGNSFILVCDEGVYLFKPLNIKKVSSLNEAKKEYLLSNYLKAIY